jgi:hypothetical protein
MSLRVWNCYTTNESVQGLPELFSGGQLVILNVTVQNLVNRNLFLTVLMTSMHELLKLLVNISFWNMAEKLGKISKQD